MLSLCITHSIHGSDFLNRELLERFKADVKKVISAQLDRATKIQIDENSDLILTDGIKLLESIIHYHIVQIYDTIFNMSSFSEFVATHTSKIQFYCCCKWNLKAHYMLLRIGVELTLQRMILRTLI